MSRRLLIAVLTVVIATSIQAQQPNHPDFTGIWALNNGATKLGTPVPDPPVTSTFIFIHRDPNWHMERTHFFLSQSPNTVAFDRVIGAEPVTTTDGDYITRTRMFWKGNTVVLDQQITGPDSSHGTNHVVYSLSADGKQLTALEREESPHSKYTNRWVFDRLPAPAMKDVYPGTGLTPAALTNLKAIIERDHGDCDPKGSKLQIDYALTKLGRFGAAVVVRSARPCDCGATGNCVIYLYQRHGDAFHELPFRNDASPSGWSFGTVTSPSGYLFFVVGSHLSSNVQRLSFYEFVRDRFSAVGDECIHLKQPGHTGSENGRFDRAHRIVESCSAK